MAKVIKKGLVEDTKVRDIDLINQQTINPLSEDEVFTFKVQLCDNDVDRVGDKMSEEFLNQLAMNIVGITGLRDHDWSSDNQTARLYAAEVVVDDKVTVTGEPRKYVLGKAYTLSKFEDYVDKINAGLLREASISFESEGDTCSICGEPTVKDETGRAHCCNGHCAGEVYDGILCYNNINKLTDIMEWSLVAVPCQRNAGIKNKQLGGRAMKKTEFFIRKFMSSKAYTKGEDEVKEEIDVALDAPDEDVSEEDIKKLIDENAKLVAENEKLKDKLREAEAGRERDKLEVEVDKALEGAGLIAPEVKELLMKEIPWEELKVEGDEIPKLTEIMDGLKEKYKGLFISEEEAEEMAGHDEPDGDEPALYVEDKVEEEEPDGDEDKITMVDKKKKGLSSPSGKIRLSPGVVKKSAPGGKAPVQIGRVERV